MHNQNSLNFTLLIFFALPVAEIFRKLRNIKYKNFENSVKTF